MQRTRRLASVLATGCITVFFSIALGAGLTACGGGGGSAPASNPALPADTSTPVVSPPQLTPPPAEADPPSTSPPPAAPALSIAIDASEPLSETVRLSIDGAVSGAVTWYADLRLLGSGNAAQAHGLAWNTLGLENGTHLLIALVQPTTGPAIELRRTVTVANSTVTLSTSVSGTTGTIAVDVRAASPLGITRVAATLDGTDVGALTQPNACSRSCGGNNDLYRFTIDANLVGSGAHVMVISATDANRASRTLTIDVPVSNAPGLSLVSPADGAMVFGTLLLAGSATSDKPGPITTTARLGDLEFLSTTASSFSGSLNLAGLPPGPYTLSVRSTDSAGQTRQSTRTVVVSASAALAYTPVLTLPTGGKLLVAQGPQILYASGDGNLLLRDLLTATERTLSGAASIQYLSGLKLDAGRVVAYGKGPDCPLYCVYLWSAEGQRTNLTLPNPHSRASNIGGGWAYDLHPHIRGDFVLWVNDKAEGTGHYTLHQLSTGEYRKIPAPAGVNYVGNNEFDFTLTGAVQEVWFWGQTAGEGTASQFDIFRWTSDTGTSSRITFGGKRHIYPQLDTTRVAWQESPVGGAADGSFSLVTRPLQTSSPITLTERATQFRLNDGVLAWVEAPSPASRAIKAADAGSPRTLSSLSSATLLANGGGWVIYTEAGKTYSWQAATATTRLRLDGVPTQLEVAGGAMVFTLGPSVYRVPLE
jgi:hypothetical protein